EGLILKRASSGDWNHEDFDVLAEGLKSHWQGFEKIKVKSSKSWIAMPPTLARVRTSSKTAMPCSLADLMTQFSTHFWRFRPWQLNFMPCAAALHAAVTFSRATLSASDSFAAFAGVGMNPMPPTSTVTIMRAIKVVTKRYMIPSLFAIEIGA